MNQNEIDEYWNIDGCDLDGLCEMGNIEVGIEDAYLEGCGAQSCPKKRTRDESSAGPKSKACREKIRRDKLNERFVELSNILDPNKPFKTDKACILSDASKLLTQLKNESQELKDQNEKLQEAIKDLKVEKNELRDEKLKLKAEKETLEHQIKTMMATPPATPFLPHPIAFHPPQFMQNGSVNKPGTQFGYPPMAAMWHWLPSAVLDTTQDAQLFPPSA